jgi:hypothetical protein
LGKLRAMQRARRMGALERLSNSRLLKRIVREHRVERLQRTPPRPGKERTAEQRGARAGEGHDPGRASGKSIKPGHPAVDLSLDGVDVRVQRPGVVVSGCGRRPQAGALAGCQFPGPFQGAVPAQVDG